MGVVVGMKEGKLTRTAKLDTNNTWYSITFRKQSKRKENGCTINVMEKVGVIYMGNTIHINPKTNKTCTCQ